jgi:hypothetical protein
VRPEEIETATFRLVVQCLHQLRQWVPTLSRVKLVITINISIIIITLLLLLLLLVVVVVVVVVVNLIELN